MALSCKHSFKRTDWRKVRDPFHYPHVVVRWFHWSWRPRIYIHYWEHKMSEMRYKKLGMITHD